MVDSTSSSPSGRPSFADQVSTSTARFTASSTAAAFHSAGSDSGDGAEISTLLPSASSNAAQCSAARAFSVSTALPLKACVHSPIRNGGHGRVAAGSRGGEPATDIASRSAAVSRTVRLTTPSVFMPVRASAATLAITRPRDGFRPTRPQCADGIRIDPEMSLAWAAATSRAATAAAEPPDDPPGVRDVAHGLCVGPNASGSHVPTLANSGVLVRPSGINPAARKASASGASLEARIPGVAQCTHAHRVRLTGLAASIVLEQERHASERAVGQGAVGITAGPLVLAVDHDVELWIELFDPLDRLVDQLARMDLVAPHQLGLSRGVEVSEGSVHR